MEVINRGPDFLGFALHGIHIVICCLGVERKPGLIPLKEEPASQLQSSLGAGLGGAAEPFGNLCCGHRRPTASLEGMKGTMGLLGCHASVALLFCLLAV